MATNAAPATTSTASPRSPIVDGFGLTGVSNRPDPTTHAYRTDLADVDLAGRVIASHYAEPLVRHLAADAPFLPSADDAAAPLALLCAGTELRVLDISRGWAWGYAPDGRVGYVRSAAVAP